MSVSVLTRAYGNYRSSANTQESVLTAAAVRSRGIKRLFSLPSPGDRRGAEAPGVALLGGRTRDLVLRGSRRPGRVQRRASAPGSGRPGPARSPTVTALSTARPATERSTR
jgi:hypothetical protein